jgi:glycosyltransferase involved in cell wall biosynthesis
MRPLTVVQLLPALAGGGVERSTLEIAEALVAAGHRSLVVSAGGRLAAPLEAGGSRHVTLDIGRKSLATLRHVRTLRALFARERPDIVHARSRLPAWLAWLALRGLPADARPRFVTSVHGLNSPGWYSSILTRGDRVVCVSRTVHDHVLRHWPRTEPARLRIIENGIDLAQFPRRADVSRAPGPLRLLLPGRGTRLKGHAEAIALLADLRAQGLDAVLLLLGARVPGRERYLDELMREATARGVAGFVQIEPPTDAIAAAYREADLVLQLSTQPESFGRTVLEALASGTPVCGWAHGGVGELLARHFPAGAVPAFDAAALRTTTLGLLATEVAPAPLQARTLADMQRDTLEVYASLAG